MTSKDNGEKIEQSQQRNEEELQYLNLVEEILKKGLEKGDRTGVGTISVFAPTPLKFDLSNGQFPLLTTKRVFVRGVIEELLWFIKGDTNSKNLKAKGVNIWEPNGSREFLDNLGFKDRKEGDLGPVYGFQWRHFGAKYIDCFTDYTGQGVDQLQNVIDTIKNKPNDRRIILSAWNPKDLNQMVLPPCHMFCQFYVEPSQQEGKKGKLHCQLYQRSCDMGLGVPFNIASYSLLAIMIAHLTNLEPGVFTHVMGDCHIYKNHTDSLKIQLEREPKQFPKIKIQLIDNQPISHIEQFQYENFVIEGYSPYPKIEMDIAV
ncbi:thymidylate synthase [Neoconidiobolus thromboides FSU 785]|nr:thymidylate synthase [Neoconidiobolus thromboides FSU 785]